MKTLLNAYIKLPLMWDLVITSVICICIYQMIKNNLLSVKIDLDLLKSFFTDLMSTTISLAGFVLASLTIIVTFKSNIDSAPSLSLNDFKNGIGILFTSKHYGTIVKIFTWSVVILFFVFITISICKIFASKIPPSYYIYLCIVPLCIIGFTVNRTLLVLYKIIKLQLQKSSSN